MTTLTGIDPGDPLVAHRREFKVASGFGGAQLSDRPILLYVLKTSAGTETAATISEDPVRDDADAVTRLGAKSMGLWVYRACASLAKNARIFLNVVDEDGSSTVASLTVTFSGAATATTTAVVEWGGERATFGVTSGDTAIAQAAAFAAAWNAASGGTWPATATIGANPNEHVITLTTTQKGVDAAAALSLFRIRYLKGTTATISSVTGGAGDHDYTAALAAAALWGQAYYHVFSCTKVTAGTSTDNGVGECAAAIASENLPAAGHNAVALFGLRGTQAQATTTATSVNSVWSYFLHSENSPHYAGVLAGALAGTMWSQQISYPAVNLDDYSNSDTTPWKIVAPYAVADWPTQAELRADANNGVIGLGVRLTGATYISRFVTSRSLTSSGGTDYRARPGKIPSVIHAFWDVVGADWQALRTAKGGGTTPNVDNDPIAPAVPLPRTVYPGDLKGIIKKRIVDLAGPAPLGRYPGPFLAQSQTDAMLASVVVTKDGPGSIGAECAVFAIEALIKSGTLIREVSDGY